jgi:hypothetical protein
MYLESLLENKIKNQQTEFLTSIIYKIEDVECYLIIY